MSLSPGTPVQLSTSQTVFSFKFILLYNLSSLPVNLGQRLNCPDFLFLNIVSLPTCFHCILSTVPLDIQIRITEYPERKGLVKDHPNSAPG